MIQPWLCYHVSKIKFYKSLAWIKQNSNCNEYRGFDSKSILNAEDGCKEITSSDSTLVLKAKAKTRFVAFMVYPVRSNKEF